jgi:hypothetical protein
MVEGLLCSWSAGPGEGTFSFKTDVLQYKVQGKGRWLSEHQITSSNCDAGCWLLAVLQRGQELEKGLGRWWASGQQRAVDASIAFTHGQQHYRYGCFAQAFCGLDGLEGLMLAASPVFGAKPP